MTDLIAAIRKDYRLKSLSEQDVDPDPVRQFDTWWKEAVASNLLEVNAMTLATSSADGVPSARIVLLKGYDERGFTFFTNYESFKGRQLAENPRACLVFFWKELERQVRITGLTEKSDPSISEAYFNSRPEGSRIGAVVSPQSQVIPNRKWLEDRIDSLTGEGGAKNMQRPEHWGGYLVRPVSIEFWQGRSNRMHDRLQYTVGENGRWIIERLAP